MTLIDLLALLNQAGALFNTVAPIMQDMIKEGRTQATPEEIAKVRALAIASEERLDAATR
jgi:hypothetical protein